MATDLGGFAALRQPKPYLDRKRDIVDESLVLVAGVGTEQEDAPSGTWLT